MKTRLLATVAAVAMLAYAGPAAADMAAAERWIDSEFQPSALSRDQQLEEMQWFIDAAAPFRGMEINVLSEGHPDARLRVAQRMRPWLGCSRPDMMFSRVVLAFITTT